MSKAPTQLDELNAIKEGIIALPDEKDGLDLRQYKRQAVASADAMRNSLAVLLKLAT